MGGCCSKKRNEAKSPAEGLVGSNTTDLGDDSDAGSEEDREDLLVPDGTETAGRKTAALGGGMFGWFGGGGQGAEDTAAAAKAEAEKKKKKKKVRSDDVVKLEVTIESAKGLRDADWVGSSDPYCILEIPSSKKGKMKNVGQTPVLENSSNPTWDHIFTCRVKIGDELVFSIFDKDMLSDELLGKATIGHDMYFPFGFKGEVRLQETGEAQWAHIQLAIKVLQAPKDEKDEDDPRKVRMEGLNFEENNIAWKKANAVVNAMESDEGLAKEESTSTALETLVRLAESGLPIPHEALYRVVACLQSTDRRYRLASLMICKALGRRVKPFIAEIGEALADADEDVRAGACKVLGTLGNASTPYVSEMGNLLHDEAPTVRSAALEALGILTHTDCLQALVVLGSCLDHEDKRYRLACCLILKAVGVKATPHAYPLAERIEQDPSVDVRVAACGTLGNIGLGAGSVQPALVSLYRAEDDPDPRVQQAAKEAIEKLKSQGRLPPRPAKDSAAAAPKAKAAASKLSISGARRASAVENVGRSSNAGSSHDHRNREDRGRGRGRGHDDSQDARGRGARGRGNRLSTASTTMKMPPAGMDDSL